MLTVARFRADLDDVKIVVKWHEELRNVLLGLPAPPEGGFQLSAEAASMLKARAPSRLPWQIFDHCAALSRIYALFEKAVCDLVEEYLRLVPRVCSDYNQLPEKLRQQHRIGVGQILSKWSNQNPLFGHLDETSIVSGFADGVRGSPYRLLGDAFLVDPDNFRVSSLQKLFGSLGFIDSFAWVKKYPAVVDFIDNRLSNNETAESFLDDFVKLRNEAAHTSPSNLVGAETLILYADFVLLIVQSLSSLLRGSLLRDGCTAGCAEKIGTVVHVWKDNVVGVRTNGVTSISVGDSIFAGKRHFEEYRVLSLRTGNTPHSSLSVAASSEFGVRLNLPLSEGSILFRWSAHS